ncbi:MAG: hypothetical protein P8080_04525 [Gammaproteobacteria bacterium]
MNRLVVIIICCTMATSALADSGDFEWSISPYLWAPQTRLDLSLEDEALGGGELSFGDLVDKIDAAFMITAEGGRNHWSVFADLAWVELSDSEQRPVFRVDTTTEAVMLDAGVAYWPGGIGAPLSFIGGLRYHDFDNRFRFRLGDTPVSEVTDSQTYYDALIGIRYRFDLGHRWDLMTRADASFGDSDGTWMLRATFGRTVGKSERNRILFGYQYRRADFSSGDLEMEFTYHGPTAGFEFRF